MNPLVIRMELYLETLRVLECAFQALTHSAVDMPEIVEEITKLQTKLYNELYAQTAGSTFIRAKPTGDKT
jgi:hypothetical protein